MDCNTAEDMVSRFIDHSLSYKQLEQFLDHIDTCESCREELETNYIVDRVISHLDKDDKDSRMDFKSLLMEDIARSRQKLRRMRFRRSLGKAALYLTVLVLAGVLSYFILFR